MRLKSLLFGIGTGLLALSPPMMIPAAAQEAPTKQEAEGIALALERGEAIYRYDQAAWHTTDALLKDIKNPGQAGIAGWVVNDVNAGLEVVFFGQGSAGLYAIWSGIYDGKKVRNKTKYDPFERLLIKSEIAQALATRIPESQEMERCSRKPFNTVVLPTGKDDGSLFVYYLVPQEEADKAPFGGHYRYEVRDGKIAASRKFTNSCISLSSRGPEGKKPVAVVISHSLDPIPTEIHVFSMYALKLSVAVMTAENEKVWMISETEDGPRVATIGASSQ